MRSKFLLFCVIWLSAGIGTSWAEEPHGHDHETHRHGGEHGKENEHEGEHEEDGEEEMSSNIGPGFAVTEADHEKGFKLSEKAMKTLAFESKPFRITASISLPTSSVVFFKDEAGVYRMRDGWIKLIEGEAKVLGGKTSFTPKGKSLFKPGDHIVTSGVPLLRVAELDAFSGSESGHAH